MQRSSQGKQFAFNLPHYDHPHAAPCYSLTLCIEHTYNAGGVCEQTNPALLIYLYIYIYII